MVLDWSQDGNRLLLARKYYDEEPTKSSDLFEFDLKQGEFLPTLIEGTSELNVVDARYSPTGDRIAFTYFDPGNAYAPNLCADDEDGMGNMPRLLSKLAVLNLAEKKFETIEDDPFGMRGPICWSPDANSILVSKYLPKDDRRELFDGTHGLAIWAIQSDGKGKKFVTTGWSPDWR